MIRKVVFCHQIHRVFLQEPDAIQLATVQQHFGEQAIIGNREATNNTPIAYIQRVRIEAAKRLLESSDHSIEAIMDQIGYNDGKAFRTVFKKITGFRPSEYRYKYGRL